MRLHYIGSTDDAPKTALLEAACRVRDIPFVHVDPGAFNYVDYTAVTGGEALYRANITAGASAIERFLLGPEVVTFYRSFERALLTGPGSYVVHAKKNIPIPRTIYFVTRDRQRLRAYVDYVGGFPVVLKATGASHGMGVMKLDSWEALFSVVDYVLPRHDGPVILRQFIDGRESARLIVLGNRVVDSIAYHAPPDDFRSNEGTVPNVTPQRFAAAVEKLAVQAVRVLGLEFGGVDVLLGEGSAMYVTEVNFPCNFARAQQLTGVDIAGQMVDYLVAKAAQ